MLHMQTRPTQVVVSLDENTHRSGKPVASGDRGDRRQRKAAALCPESGAPRDLD